MPADDLNSFFNQKLEERKEKGLLRRLGENQALVDFASNDYLGLARSEELNGLIEEKRNAIAYANGATGSRLLTGNSAYTETVEKKLAAVFRAPSCLLFNSGYTANLSVLSSLPQKGDTIIYDELAHACIKDGARLSMAGRFSFRHNDLDDLERKIKRSAGKIFVAVESVYSMDGDEAPLPQLAALVDKYDIHLIVDEAHSTGILGPAGSGLAVACGVENKIAARIYTFGKAMGIHGACVAGSEALTTYLLNFARPFIYTTALPPHAVLSVDAAFDYLAGHEHLQNELAHKIDLFKRAVPAGLTQAESKSAIHTAVFPGNENVRKMASALQQQGLDVRPILSPTVPAGTERLRICLHTYNTDAEINALTSALHTLTQHEQFRYHRL